MGSTIMCNFFPLESDYTTDEEKKTSIFYSIYILQVEKWNEIS